MALPKNTPLAQVLSLGTVITLGVLLLSVVLVQVFFADFISTTLGFGIDGELDTIGAWSMALMAVFAVGIVVAAGISLVLNRVD